MKRILVDIIAFLLFVLAYWGVTYTNDWYTYEWVFNGDLESDFFITQMSLVFVSLGLEYRDLFRLHILLIGFLFVVLSRKFKASSIGLVFLLLLTNYVAIGNQIRYYMAFPLALWSLYEGCYKKRPVLYVLLAVLSVLCHKGVILFHALFWAYMILKKWFRSSFLFIWICVNIFGVFFIFSLPSLGNEHFSVYAGEGMVSSFLGGVFSNLIAFFALWFVFITNKRMEKSGSSDQLNSFLYNISVASSLVLLSSCFIQIIGTRMIRSLLPVWIIYLYKSNSSDRRVNTAFYIVCIITFDLFCMLLLPQLIGIKNYTFEFVGEMLRSYSFD